MRLPTVALRYFSVYGSHRALSNPDDGVVAIFSARLVDELLPRGLTR
jgi:nucleoside-diphosphate-sugar epimerase